jgi:hypothetical protein
MQMFLDNAFGVLKKTFKELFGNFELHAIFILNLMVCACILHNLLRLEGESHVQTFMHNIDFEVQKKIN